MWPVMAEGRSACCELGDEFALSNFVQLQFARYPCVMRGTQLCSTVGILPVAWWGLSWHEFLRPDMI